LSHLTSAARACAVRHAGRTVRGRSALPVSESQNPFVK
jgi:hypothetical protein